MLQFLKESVMPRIPQPSQYQSKPWRPEPMPADYSDDLSEVNFEALRALAAKEIDEDDFVLVDGPAW